MTTLAEMIREDEKKATAKSMLKDKVSIEFILRHIGLDESTVRVLQTEITNEE